jgi:hypothetical protein
MRSRAAAVSSRSRRSSRRAAAAHRARNQQGAGVWGSGASLVGFVRAGFVDRKRAPAVFAAGFVGSLGGAALVLLLAPELLRPIVLVLLVAVAIFPRLSAAARPGAAARYHLGGGPVSWALAATVRRVRRILRSRDRDVPHPRFVFLLGHGLTRASAEAKVVNFAPISRRSSCSRPRAKSTWALRCPWPGAADRRLHRQPDRPPRRRSARALGRSCAWWSLSC